MAPGEVLQFEGPGNQNLCVSADGESAAFVYIPFFGKASDAEDPESIEFDVTAAGTATGVSGLAGSLTGFVPDASIDGSAPRWTLNHEFHHRLRQREIAELGPRIRTGAPDAGAAATPSLSGSHVAADLPQVGELVSYNVAISCEQEDLRTGRVMYISDHAVVVADTANPSDLSPADYAYFGITFDTLVYPVETAHFGTPTDIDDNGRSILFFTRAVNERNPPDARSVIIGFFWSGDLFPEQETARLQACPAANQAEMFYLIAPDPNGEVGVPFTLANVRQLAIPLIGHEYQHLINASRRLFVNNATTFEETWLNEGLSHIAEELLFYAVSGLEPGQNLGVEDIRNTPGAVEAFNEYMRGNASNFASYLSRPDTASLMGIDNLATRGATWAFLRYAADRSGRSDEQFFFDLVNAVDAGVPNLNDVLAPGRALDWMADWTVSVYGDDFVPGLPEKYAFLSWDLRSVYSGTGLGEYPLRTRTLAPGVTQEVDLYTGGAAYMLFGTEPGGPGALHVETEGGTPPAVLRGSLLRAR